MKKDLDEMDPPRTPVILNIATMPRVDVRASKPEESEGESSSSDHGKRYRKKRSRSRSERTRTPEKPKDKGKGSKSKGRESKGCEKDPRASPRARLRSGVELRHAGRIPRLPLWRRLARPC